MIDSRNCDREADAYEWCINVNGCALPDMLVRRFVGRICGVYDWVMETGIAE